MTNWEWEKFGDDIRRTVQDAVDSMNFEQLNQSINDTINQAVDGIGKGIRDAGDKVDKSIRSQYRYQPGRTGGQAAPQYKRQDRLQTPVLYRKTTGVKAGGVALTAVGYTIGGGMLLALAAISIGAFAMGEWSLLLRVLMATGTVLFGISAVLAGVGTSMRGRVKRFRSYIESMEEKEYGEIKELAKKVRKSPRYVIKDLEKMIQEGWFRQGHLDHQKTCLMVTHDAYRQYQELVQHLKEQKKQESDRNEQQAKAFSQTDPRIQEILKTGDAYIQKIHACNDAIAGHEISAKISRMETLVDRIFDRVERKPEYAPEIRRLMEYYLPTTVKLLEAYEELDRQPVQGENIVSSKKEIEDTLSTLNVAFEKLLDSLFQDTAWDVSSDISVLHTILAQEGLTEDDFS